MITFTNIGLYGRLSNQMFQYATLLSLSLKRGYNFFIPLHSQHSDTKRFDYTKENDDYFRFLLTDCFDLNKCNFADYNTNNYTKFYENNNQYDLSVFDVPDNTDILGYFCNEVYFKEYKEHVLDEFKFKEVIQQQGNLIINNIKKDLSLVSLHVRRGDYLRYSDTFDLVDKKYYDTIVYDIIGENNSMVYICSDDIDWCKKNLQYKNVYYSTHSKYVDLYVQTQSNYNIISNSTFSWWGAYLNNNQIVFRPQFYLKTNVDPNKFYLPHWIVI